VTDTVSATHFTVLAVAFAPDGRVVARYQKVHLVPFGEYIPLRGFFSHFASLAAVPIDALPGHGDGVLRTPVGELGAMISYEVFFADRSRTATRDGAELLLVPTNTSSYSTGQVPSQEVAAARLAAVSDGRDLVQAAPTGYSAIIDHRGNVRTRSSLGGRAVLVENVALRRGLTIYDRLGDLPVLAVAALAIAISGLVGLRRPPRRRRPLPKDSYS
jgi:apolipoprotein N-acyltransferase